MVFPRAFGDRVVFPGKQAGRARGSRELAEHVMGVGVPLGEQVGLDQPRDAQVKAALGVSPTNRSWLTRPIELYVYVLYTHVRYKSILPGESAAGIPNRDTYSSTCTYFRWPA